MNTFRRPKLNKEIRAIKHDAEFTYNNDDVSTIIWCNDTTPIPAEDILAKLAELQAEYDALDYARARDKAYPQLKEFAEAYTEKEIGGDDTKWNEYVTKYNKVRTDNPKG